MKFLCDNLPVILIVAALGIGMLSALTVSNESSHDYSDDDDI